MQRMAARHGLDVPRSLVSNDPDAVRAFAARFPGGLVGKLIESGGVSLQGAGGLSAFPTFAVTPYVRAAWALDRRPTTPSRATSSRRRGVRRAFLWMFSRSPENH